MENALRHAKELQQAVQTCMQQADAAAAAAAGAMRFSCAFCHGLLPVLHQDVTCTVTHLTNDDAAACCL